MADIASLRELDVVVAGDHHFLDGLHTTIASIALHEQTVPLKIHLLDGGIFDDDWKLLCNTVARLNGSAKMIRHSLADCKISQLSKHGELGTMTYARVLVPRFVEAPFAVYVDADFLVTLPLSKALAHFRPGKAIHASREGMWTLAWDCPWGEGCDLDAYPYANCGLLLLDLEKWRRERIDEVLLDFLEKESSRCRHADQSAINWLLKDDIELLPPEWNSVVQCSPSYKPPSFSPGGVNFHYASGMKPWKRFLPILPHKLWWLFTRSFISPRSEQQLLLKPRNLFRYARFWLQEAKNGNLASHRESLLDPWKKYWDGFRNR